MLVPYDSLRVLRYGKVYNKNPRIKGLLHTPAGATIARDFCVISGNEMAWLEDKGKKIELAMKRVRYLQVQGGRTYKSSARSNFFQLCELAELPVLADRGRGERAEGGR